jgi:hypothetical protein
MTSSGAILGLSAASATYQRGRLLCIRKLFPVWLRRAKWVSDRAEIAVNRKKQTHHDTAAEIAVNGQLLHEISMKLRPYNVNVSGSTLYPAHRMQIQYKPDGLHLNVPGLLAVQLYFQGIISQDKEQEIIISIDGNPIGKYKIIDLLYFTLSDPRPETVSFVLEEVI